MIDEIRFIHRAWKYKRDDKAEIKFLYSNITKGDVVIDIGAHKGGYTYWLRKLTGSSGKVFAFEPQPELAKYLEKIVSKRSKYKSITVESIGLSSNQGEMDLIIPNLNGDASPGATFVTRKMDEEPYCIEKVKVDTLDNYFAAKEKRPVTFIKCDVEGHELEVFRGGINLLKEDIPALLFECESRHLQSGNIYDVFSFIEDIGYRGYFFLNGEVVPISQFELEKHQKIQEGRFWEALGYCNNFCFTSSS